MKSWITAWMAAAAFAMADDLPPVEKAIPEPVKALAPPIDLHFEGGLQIAVTAATEKAQAEVLQGLNHLHGGWEFEASRHFAVAMREDPECLLAHWGMVMSLLSPSPETDEALHAASERLLALIEQGKGTELERGYAYGLVKYIQEGPGASADAFYKVAKRFPNDMQASIFAALFGRGGFDTSGSPTPLQEEAEKRLSALVEKFPDSPLPLHALLLIRAEGPDLKPSLEAARKLSRMAPNYAPYFHLLGHYEWRCGEHARATAAFSRATSLFDRWMKENNVSVADCPEWVKAECYRIVALGSKGDFDTAYAASRGVAATPLPDKRTSSRGYRILLWEAKTLPARILMKRGLPGNAKEAMASLPTPETLKPTRGVTIASWWIDAVRIALDADILAETGKNEDAMKSAALLAQHAQKMTSFQTAASKAGERSELNRAFHAIEVLASELNGRIALAGDKATHGSALNWFLSAKDRQQRSSLLYPPVVLAPMAARVGDYYAISRQPDKAVESYNEALEEFPNDIDTLKSLQKAYEAGGHKEKTAETGALIERLEKQQ
jgi:tetratricopeptide (TPR) repeat protein